MSIHIVEASTAPPEVNTTPGESFVGKKKKRVRIKAIIVFKDNCIEESAFPPLNKKKKCGNTSQQPIQEAETTPSNPHYGK